MTSSNFLKIFIISTLAFFLLNSCDRGMGEDEMLPTQNTEQATFGNTESNDDEDYDDEYEDILGYEFDFDCFDVEFPVEIDFPNTGIQSFDDYDATEEALENWAAQNPEATELPSLIFPITLIYEDEERVVINSEEALIAEIELCEEEDCDEEHDEEEDEEDDDDDDDEEDDDNP